MARPKNQTVAPFDQTRVRKSRPGNQKRGGRNGQGGRSKSGGQATPCANCGSTLCENVGGNLACRNPGSAHSRNA